MKTKAPRSEESYATEAEVREAVGRLGDADLERLRRYADLRARALAALGLGIGGSDLLQEALSRTLAGKRKWPKSVKFVQHLLGAVRSISSGLAKRMKGVVVETDLLGDGEGDESHGIELASPLADPERLAAVHEELAHIEQLFSSDERALLVIEGLKDRMEGPEIKEWLGLSQTEFETVMKRLRRGVRGKE